MEVDSQAGTKRRLDFVDGDNKRYKISAGLSELPKLKCAWVVGELRYILYVVRLGAQVIPSFVFLCEMKTSRKKVEKLKVRLDFSGCFTVNSKGSNGGLIMFWVASLGVTIWSFSEAHINLVITYTSGI